MIPKYHRYTEKVFERVRKKGIKRIGTGFDMIYSDKTQHLRIGIMLKKKSFTSSVKRNKYRRMLYDRVFSICKAHNLPRINIIFIPHNTNKSNFIHLQSDITKLMSKAF